MDGCDICQSVCPHNRKLADVQSELRDRLVPEKIHPDLIKLVKEGKPRVQTLIALGNNPQPAAVEPLVEFLIGDEAGQRPDLRAYAAWALGEIGDRRAVAGLRDVLARETDTLVREEIETALQACERPGKQEK